MIAPRYNLTGYNALQVQHNNIGAPTQPDKLNFATLYQEKLEGVKEKADRDTSFAKGGGNLSQSKETTSSISNGGSEKILDMVMAAWLQSGGVEQEPKKIKSNESFVETPSVFITEKENKSPEKSLAQYIQNLDSSSDKASFESKGIGGLDISG
ncbi:MAG: hypothetical protein OIF32_07075 [Campylobacterales bacterium]|nr:hypothetical protein [Campylobacterales bacterium]